MNARELRIIIGNLPYTLVANRQIAITLTTWSFLEKPHE